MRQIIASGSWGSRIRVIERINFLHSNYLKINEGNKWARTPSNSYCYPSAAASNWFFFLKCWRRDKGLNNLNTLPGAEGEKKKIISQNHAQTLNIDPEHALLWEEGLSLFDWVSIVSCHAASLLPLFHLSLLLFLDPLPPNFPKIINENIF